MKKEEGKEVAARSAETAEEETEEGIAVGAKVKAEESLVAGATEEGAVEEEGIAVGEGLRAGSGTSEGQMRAPQ